MWFFEKTILLETVENLGLQLKELYEMHVWLQGVVVSDRRCCVQFDSGGVVACERRSDTDASRPGKAVTIEFIFGGGCLGDETATP